MYKQCFSRLRILEHLGNQDVARDEKVCACFFVVTWIAVLASHPRIPNLALHARSQNQKQENEKKQKENTFLNQKLCFQNIFQDISKYIMFERSVGLCWTLHHGKAEKRATTRHRHLTALLDEFKVRLDLHFIENFGQNEQINHCCDQSERFVCLACAKHHRCVLLGKHNVSFRASTVFSCRIMSRFLVRL